MKTRRSLGSLMAAAFFVGAVALGHPGAWAQGARDDALVDGAKKLSCRDPRSKDRRLQIAGGQDARVSDFRFIVQLRVGKGLCGGSIFAPGFVLTAAHCVMPVPGDPDCKADGEGRCKLADPASIRVTRPGPDGRASGEKARAVAVFAHPKFRYPISDDDPGGLDADVAIVVLDRRFEAPRGDYVNLASPRSDRSFAKGGECARIAGWGLTDVLDSRLRVISKGDKTDRLQALNLELQPAERCEKQYEGQITGNMLCAGDGVEGFNTCKGDSGGPLVVDAGVPVQVGIVSWAYGCAQQEHYTIFTRVGAKEVRDWINETVLGDRG